LSNGQKECWYFRAEIQRKKGGGIRRYHPEKGIWEDDDFKKERKAAQFKSSSRGEGTVALHRRESRTSTLKR